jgi:DNA repair exonuclease SbcCD nuclease subunit
LPLRILHSSDLHLSEKRPETFEALEALLDEAQDMSVNVLTLSGDIFDSCEDAEVLRPRLRKVFSNNNFDIIAVPGNHDLEAYRTNLDFGSNLKVAINTPYEVFNYDDVNVVALPYTHHMDAHLLSSLKSVVKDDKVYVLLVHCTLDIGFSGEDFGESESSSYCPVSRAVLGLLGFDYVLAGHFHKSTIILPLGSRGKFVYPGSPVSHSVKETGRRQAIFVDTAEGVCKSVPLKSFYYDFFNVTVSPGTEDKAINDIRMWVSERSKDSCSLKIVVNGFIVRDEKIFLNELRNAAGCAEVETNYRNVKEVLEHPLFVRFKKKLIEKHVEKSAEVEERVIEVFSRLLANGELKP